MGEVWRGVHVEQRVPVAVKLLSGPRAREDATLELFHNEVRAVARLDHPGIVMVLDYGQASAETARRSGSRIVEGSPFLAMELAPGGTLPRPRAPMPWPRLRALTLELLDALSHAHARGVVHRDIKPGNILIGALPDGRARLKLTDFGIARALGVGEGREGIVSGTPHYMSPEQILDERRDQGPWTDLYALGCLVYQFATGERLFAPARGLDLLRAHVYAAPPRVQRPDLPAGFQDWLERMLAKSVHQRYAFAADAAYGLLQLDPSATGPDLPSGDAPQRDDSLADALASGGDTVRIAPEVLGLVRGDAGYSSGSSEIVAFELPEPAPLTELATLAEIVHTVHSVELLDGSEDVAAPLRTPFWPLPPCPESWRRRERIATPMRLRGAGLGLFGLRTVPLVDRDAARDHIWQALREVAQCARARLVLVQGGAGHGKSRLVEWLTERAHELGAACVLHATHTAVGSRADGLATMIAAHLGCVGLDRDAARVRARRFIAQHELGGGGDGREEDDALALVELAMPDAPAAPGSARVRFASPAERHDALERFVARVAAERPVILWLDDVQWGADALLFVQALLSARAERASLPVLVLATVRDDLLATRAVETALCAELAAHPRASVLSLGPLADDDQRQLVEHLLGLDSDLVEHVALRTCGNPLFAIQLVGDWVQRGVLEPGREGFRLRAGEQADIPDDIHALWTARLAQLLRATSEPAAGWLALELAAALGKDFDPVEWHAVCALAGVELPRGLVDRLLTHHLLESTQTGLGFAHGMLCESLERAAREAGRLARHHAVCAQMLEQRASEGLDTTLPERRGAHLRLAGQLEEALEPLLQGAIARQHAGDFRQAHELFAQRAEAMARLGVAEDDARWGLGWVRQARACFMQGRAEDAHALAARAAEAAARHGWLEIAALAGTEQANASFAMGRVADAVALHEAALECYARLPESSDHADALRHVAKVLMTRHEMARGEAALRKSLAIFERQGDEIGAAPALRHLAAVEVHHGRPRQAAAMIEEAMRRFKAHGFRRSVASCLNDLGEVWRHSGRLAEAERYYRESARLYDAVGSRIAVVPRLNHALLLISQARYEEARELLAPLLAEAESESGRILEEPWYRLASLPCCAAAGDWERFATHLRLASATIARQGVVDADLADVACLGGELAAAAGERELAEAALRFALDQARRLQDERRVVRIEAALGGL